MMSSLVKSWVEEGAIKAETIYGIELLNEPFGFFEPVWECVRDRFYYMGYDSIRAVWPDSDVKVVVQTSFKDWSDFDDYMQSNVSFSLEGLVIAKAFVPL